MNPTERILFHFEQISAVPRGTRHEAGIRDWLAAWAAERGVRTRADAAGNLVMYVPAAGGCQASDPVILQGHLDMVWQKTPESSHDFLRDPIRLQRQGDWITAGGTTLGADNGIAIALMMALAEAVDFPHPPLEMLLTVEEEKGMVGALNLEAALLSGKALINLDSEKEGTLTTGSASGAGATLTVPVTWTAQAPNETPFRLAVAGLRGGHSGEDIQKHRTNAVKLLGRFLDYLLRGVPLRLSDLHGGSVANAIPREAEAVFLCTAEHASQVNERFAALQSAVQAELGGLEPGLALSCEPLGGEPGQAASLEETGRIIRLLNALPDGVAAMSPSAPGSVETSNNIGIASTGPDGVKFVSLHRSSVFSRLEEMVFRIDALAQLAGASTEHTRPRPPWAPNPNSELLKKCVAVYESQFGVQPEVKVSHGGLECGVISERCGGLDSISIGPTIQSPHSPDERLFVPSLERFWTFLTALLGAYC